MSQLDGAELDAPLHDADTVGTTLWTAGAFKIANVIGASICILLAAAILVGAQAYPLLAQNGQPGPGLYPVVIGVALLALSTAWLIGTLANRYHVYDEMEAPPDRSALVRALLSFALVGATAFAVQPLGYLLTIAIAVVLLTVLGGGRWRAALVTGPVFAVATFFLVTTLLGVQLPAGILRPLIIHFL